MLPTSEELQLGAAAYEQVRIYEKYTARNLKQLPWIVTIACLFAAAILILSHPAKDHQSGNYYPLSLLPFFILLAWNQKRISRKLYASNKILLQLLQEKYGDSLPWIKGEKDLAAARDLEAAIKREQPPL